MTAKRLLVTGAGGAPALNFIRSLRASEEDFYIIGVDADAYHLERSEADESYLVPAAADPAYLRVLNQITAQTDAQLLFAQPDAEVAVLSARRDELLARTFWPKHSTILTCHNKYDTYQAWSKHGLRVPETRLLDGEEDLRSAIEDFGDIWLRLTTGAAGRGSFHTSDLAQARGWIEFNGGFGGFSAAQYLSPDTVTWQSVWQNGELVVAQSRRRLSWELADRSPSGVTGVTGAGETLSDPVVDEIALSAIRAVDDRPHGIFGVDLTYDSTGVPNPTEINIGRFFTTHLFFTEAGLNMPYIVVKLAFGEDPGELPGRINPLAPGLVWVRGMDKLPILTDRSEIEASREKLRERLQSLDDGER